MRPEHKKAGDGLGRNEVRSKSNPIVLAYYLPWYTRRKIGTQVMHESNEILRSIFGQLIRALLDADIAIEHLWPAKTKEVLYRSFPPASQGDRGWNDLFQEYVDVIWSEIGQSESSVYL